MTQTIENVRWIFNEKTGASRQPHNPLSSFTHSSITQFLRPLETNNSSFQPIKLHLTFSPRAILSHSLQKLQLQNLTTQHYYYYYYYQQQQQQRVTPRGQLTVLSALANFISPSASLSLSLSPTLARICISRARAKWIRPGARPLF